MSKAARIVMVMAVAGGVIGGVSLTASLNGSTAASLNGSNGAAISESAVAALFSTTLPAASGQAPAPGQGERWPGDHPLLAHLSEGQLDVELGGRDYHVVLDHGTVQTVSVAAITLLEPNGSPVTVPLSSDTRVRLDRQDASISDVKAGYVAFVLRQQGNPARFVATFDPSALPAAPEPSAGA